MPMQKPKGTRDLLGKELASIRHVTHVMNNTFKRYGYEEIETPTFEYLELRSHSLAPRGACPRGGEG